MSDPTFSDSSAQDTRLAALEAQEWIEVRVLSQANKSCRLVHAVWFLLDLGVSILHRLWWARSFKRNPSESHWKMEYCSASKCVSRKLAFDAGAFERSPLILSRGLSTCLPIA